MPLGVDVAEVDSVEVIVIVDNEVDTFAKYPAPGVEVSGGLGDVAVRSDHHITDRGEVKKELRMSSVCCGAFGLSLMVVCAAPLWSDCCNVISDLYPRQP